jgi:transcription initiation factor IIE alpha subunit
MPGKGRYPMSKGGKCPKCGKDMKNCSCKKKSPPKKK